MPRRSAVSRWAASSGSSAAAVSSAARPSGSSPLARSARARASRAGPRSDGVAAAAALARPRRVSRTFPICARSQASRAIARVPASARTGSGLRAAAGGGEAARPADRHGIEFGAHLQVVGAGQNREAVPARQDLEIDEAPALRIADGALRRRGDHRDRARRRGRATSPSRAAAGRGPRRCGRTGSGLRIGIEDVARAQGRRPPRVPRPGPLPVVTALRSTRRPCGTGKRRTVSGPERAGRPIGTRPWRLRRYGHRLCGLEGQRGDAAALEQDGRRQGLERKDQAGSGVAPSAAPRAGASGAAGASARLAGAATGAATAAAGRRQVPAPRRRSWRARAACAGPRRGRRRRPRARCRSANPSSGVTRRLAEVASISVASLAMPGRGRPRVSPASMVQAPTTRRRVAGPSAVTVVTASAGRRSDRRVSVGSRASSRDRGLRDRARACAPSAPPRRPGPGGRVRPPPPAEAAAAGRTSPPAAGRRTRARPAHWRLIR